MKLKVTNAKPDAGELQDANLEVSSLQANHKLIVFRVPEGAQKDTLVMLNGIGLYPAVNGNQFILQADQVHIQGV